MGILNESRSIIKLYASMDDWIIDDKGVTFIEPYVEVGGALWFAIWINNKIAIHVNSAFVESVDYRTSEDNNG